MCSRGMVAVGMWGGFFDPLITALTHTHIHLCEFWDKKWINGMEAHGCLLELMLGVQPVFP